MKFQGNLSSVLGSDTQSVDPNPSFLTLTPSTIALGYGSEVFQLSNITRIGKYRHKSKSILWVIGAFVLGVSGISSLFSSLSSYNGGPMALFGIILLLVAASLMWFYTRPGLFAFGFECSSGASRYVYTPDEKFIAEIVDIVSSYMETKQAFGTQINVDNRTIERSIVLGSVNQGDKSNVR